MERVGILKVKALDFCCRWSRCYTNRENIWNGGCFKEMDDELH